VADKDKNGSLLYLTSTYSETEKVLQVKVESQSQSVIVFCEVDEQDSSYSLLWSD